MFFNELDVTTVSLALASKGSVIAEFARGSATVRCLCVCSSIIEEHITAVKMMEKALWRIFSHQNRKHTKRNCFPLLMLFPLARCCSSSFSTGTHQEFMELKKIFNCIPILVFPYLMSIFSTHQPKNPRRKRLYLFCSSPIPKV